MFNDLVDTLNESIKNANIEDTLNEDIDALLDEECKKSKKENCEDPAECESPKDESLVFSYTGDVKTLDINSKVNALKEGFGLNAFDDVETFMNKMGDHSSKLFDISGEEISLEESIKTACLFEECYNSEEKDDSILMEGQIIDEEFTSTLNEAVEYVFDKDTASLNVKKLLEKKNFKMQKKGYVPLTSVNAILKAEIEKLKSIKDSTKAFSGIKAIKIQGVVCLQYKIGGKDYKNISVCYYNKDKASIRMFDVNASQKK